MSLATLLLTEFFGTMILVLLGNGIVANVVLKKTKENETGGLISIAFGWGMAVFVAASVSASLGGVAHLNPAVSIFMAIKSEAAWGLSNLNQNIAPAVGFFSIIILQFIGGAIGSLLVDAVYWNHIKITRNEDPNDDFQTRYLAMHSTSPTYKNSMLLSFIMEVVGTMVLLIGIASFVKFNTPNFMGPLLVGLTVLAIGLSLSGTTGYAINPARDLGPRLTHYFLPVAKKGSSDWKYAWIPVAAPCTAAILLGLIGLGAGF